MQIVCQPVAAKEEGFSVHRWIRQTNLQQSAIPYIIHIFLNGLFTQDKTALSFLVCVGSVNTNGDKTRQFCLMSFVCLIST